MSLRRLPIAKQTLAKVTYRIAHGKKTYDDDGDKNDQDVFSAHADGIGIDDEATGRCPEAQ